MSQDLFPKRLSSILKLRAGEKYRPSNGTEGEMFMERWCYDCKKDENHDCPILGSTFFLDVEDPGYPTEWQYGPDGQPKCTAFVRIGTEEQIKPLPGQMELF